MGALGLAGVWVGAGAWVSGAVDCPLETDKKTAPMATATAMAKRIRADFLVGVLVITIPPARPASIVITRINSTGDTFR
jgi:hypothetical protein